MEKFVKPWQVVPLRIISLALVHAEKNTDFDHQFAYLLLDIGIETILKTYLINRKIDVDKFVFSELLQRVGDELRKDNLQVSLDKIDYFHKTRNELYYQIGEVTPPVVFVSYAWGGESERTVDELEQVFVEHDIHIVRDKKDLNYKGSIKEFEQRIGQGQCIILVINDKYLRSEHCMYELVEIDENKDFRNRIFPIVLGDAHIYNVIDRVNYIHYWDKQIEKLNQAVKKVGVMTNLREINATLEKYVHIRAKFDNLTNLLSDMNALTPEIHASGGFSTLISVIKSALASRRSENDQLSAQLRKYADLAKTLLKVLLNVDIDKSQEQKIIQTSQFPFLHPISLAGIQKNIVSLESNSSLVVEHLHPQIATRKIEAQLRYIRIDTGPDDESYLPSVRAEFVRQRIEAFNKITGLEFTEDDEADYEFVEYIIDVPEQLHVWLALQEISKDDWYNDWEKYKSAVNFLVHEQSKDGKAEDKRYEEIYEWTYGKANIVCEWVWAHIPNVEPKKSDWNMKSLFD